MDIQQHFCQAIVFTYIYIISHAFNLDLDFPSLFIGDKVFCLPLVEAVPFAFT